MIPPKLSSFRHPSTSSVIRCRNDLFKNSFIPYVVREWNRLCTEIRNSTSWQELGNRFYLLVNKPAFHWIQFVTLLVSNH